MPIYTYDCPVDGVQDVLFRTYDAPSTHMCPECYGSMGRCVTLPGRVEIKRDWNEKANDYQHDPYTQSKAQLRNLDREEQLHQDASPMKITEESIQAGAKAIHETKLNPPKNSVQRMVESRQRKRRKEPN